LIITENREKNGGWLTCDWETTEAPSLLKSLGLCDSGSGRNNNGVKNESVLEALDLANHLRLVILRAVVVDHTKTAQESNVDSHVMFGDGVHGRRDEGGLEGDALRDRGVKVDIDGGEA
jgi:hypothetical protein